MVSVAGRLYRMDDRLMTKDVATSDAAIFYDIDSTQPYSTTAEFVDPDMTRAFIDSAKLSGNRRSLWMDISPSKAWQWLTVIIVAGALLYGFLVGGGI